MAKRTFEEERALLLVNGEYFEVSHRNCFPKFESAVTKGVVNQVGKWPSHLFAAFLTASLIFAAFILFAVVTTLFCIPSVSYGCREANDVDIAEFPNVYFVKHSNRTWSRTELCHIESSARDNPDVNVYLINLLANLPDSNHLFLTRNVDYVTLANNKKGTSATLVFSEPTDNAIDSSSNITEEARIRWRLGARYLNVRNIDVTMQDFFKGSMLANVFHKFDVEAAEIAAKANIIWNSPGIALDPSDFRQIRNATIYLRKQGCNLVRNAAINPQGSFQASAVPCHAFFDYLMRQAATNSFSAKRDITRRARGKFCKSVETCPGLDIYHDFPQIDQSLYCPVVNPAAISDQKIIMFRAQSSGFSD